MEFVHVSITDGIAEARLKRGKVNALSEPVVEEITDTGTDETDLEGYVRSGPQFGNHIKLPKRHRATPRRSDGFADIRSVAVLRNLFDHATR